MNEILSPVVSVIIPVYNGEATIRRALECALSQQGCPAYEVIVVNDGSTDRTGEVVREFQAVRLIEQANAGPASARNRGALSARGEYLCFTDSDCLPHPDWIARSLSGFGPEGVAAVMGTYGIANPESWLAVCVHDEIQYRHRTLLPEYPQVFGSYNVCIQKQIFLELNGFDTTYRSPSGEDNDLSYRLGKKGFRIRFVNDSKVDHFHPVSVRKYLREQFRHGFWRAKMYRKHFDKTRGDDYTFWKDALEVAIVYAFFALGVVSLFEFGMAGIGAAFLLTALLVLEIVFAFLTVSLGWTKKLAFAMVLAARSFARGSGFLCGMVRR